MNSPIHTSSPDVAKIAIAAFPDYTGRKLKVCAFVGPKRLDSYWSGGSRDYFAILSLSTLKTVEVPQNGTPFDGRLSGGAYLSELPQGAALVEHSIFCGKDMGCTVYVNPVDLTPLLPAPIDLTWSERVVLAATRSYTSAYRVEGAKLDTGISTEEFAAARKSLADKGLLDKRGAITNDGRNAIGDINPHSLKRETLS